MSYEIEYDLTQKEQAQLQAIEDIKSWSSASFYYGRDAVMNGATWSQYSFLMGMGGVQGYPCVALWEDTKQACRDMSM